MPEAEKNRENTDLADETMSANDACALPAISQVEAPADLNEGIPEPPDEERYIDEP